MSVAESEAIKKHIQALWDKHEEVREQATEALGQIGAPAVPALLAALRKDDRTYEVIEYENPDLRKAILRVGEPAFRALIAALQPGSDMVRAAAKTLALFRDPRAVEPLINAALDTRVEVNGRLYAIDALATFHDLRAYEPLVTLLSDKELFVRSHAALALAEYGDLSLVPKIKAALADQPESDKAYLREGLYRVLSTLQWRAETKGPTSR